MAGTVTTTPSLSARETIPTVGVGERLPSTVGADDGFPDDGTESTGSESSGPELEGSPPRSFGSFEPSGNAPGAPFGGGALAPPDGVLGSSSFPGCTVGGLFADGGLAAGGLLGGRLPPAVWAGGVGGGCGLADGGGGGGGAGFGGFGGSGELVTMGWGAGTGGLAVAPALDPPAKLVEWVPTSSHDESKGTTAGRAVVTSQEKTMTEAESLRSRRPMSGPASLGTEPSS